MDYTYFACPSCHAKLKTSDPAISGRKIRCPKCGSPSPVPDFAPAEVAVSAVEEDALDSLINDIVDEEFPPEVVMDEKIVESAAGPETAEDHPTATEHAKRAPAPGTAAAPARPPKRSGKDDKAMEKAKARPAPTRKPVPTKPRKK